MNYIDFYFDNINIRIDHSKLIPFRKGGGGSIGGKFSEEGVCCFIRNQFIQLETITNNSYPNIGSNMKDVHYKLLKSNKSHFDSLNTFLNDHISYLDYVVSAPIFTANILNEETNELITKSMSCLDYPYNKEGFTDIIKNNITYLYSFNQSMIRFAKVDFTQKCAKSRNIKIESILK